MALALLSGFALAEGIPEMPDGDLNLGMPENAGDLEIGKGGVPELGTDETPDESGPDLDLGSLDPVSEATYSFIVDGEVYATQVAKAGDEILCPKAPEAPRGEGVRRLDAGGRHAPVCRRGWRRGD
jgi:hypothetical protein